MPSNHNLSLHQYQVDTGVNAVADEGAVAMPSEDSVSPLVDDSGFPVDPAFAKLSTEDKAMFTSGGDDVSHFTGSMTDNESEFAETQGAETEMFGLSDEVRSCRLSAMFYSRSLIL